MILSATMMLRHLGYVHAYNDSTWIIYSLRRLDNIANSIASATFSVIDEAKVRTQDMGGAATTSEFTAEIIKKL